MSAYVQRIPCELKHEPSGALNAWRFALFDVISGIFGYILNSAPVLKVLRKILA